MVVVVCVWGGGRMRWQSPCTPAPASLHSLPRPLPAACSLSSRPSPHPRPSPPPCPQLLGVVLVMGGVCLAAWPAGGGSPLTGISPFYALVFSFSMLFPALDTILKERVFRCVWVCGGGGGGCVCVGGGGGGVREGRSPGGEEGQSSLWFFKERALRRKLWTRGGGVQVGRRQRWERAGGGSRARGASWLATSGRAPALDPAVGTHGGGRCAPCPLAGPPSLPPWPRGPRSFTPRSAPPLAAPTF